MIKITLHIGNFKQRLCIVAHLQVGFRPGHGMADGLADMGAVMAFGAAGKLGLVLIQNCADQCLSHAAATADNADFNLGHDILHN